MPDPIDSLRPAKRRQAGQCVERLVADWFASLGYEILDRNFSHRLGEIDVVMRARGRTLVFVEIRYRRSARFGGPVASVDTRKRERLRRVASIWASRHDCWHSVQRLDVVGAMPLSAATLGGTMLSARPRRDADGRYVGAYGGLALTWIPGAIEA